MKTISLWKRLEQGGDIEEMACLRLSQVSYVETGWGQLVETSDGSAKDDYNWRYPR